MDVFSGTFLPAAAEAGIAAGRLLPIFRSCVEADDPTVLVGRGLRPEAPKTGEFTLLLTRRRLVVIHETKVLHRRRLHLNANLRHLTNVTWSADLARSAVEVAATAVDGVRERFRLRLGGPSAAQRSEALLENVFRPSLAAAS
jgi:hypothetical protein